MLKREKILDNTARVAGAAVGILSGASSQAKTAVRVAVESFASDMDLVPREELERLEAVIELQKKEHDALKIRLEALEKKIN